VLNGLAMAHVPGAYGAESSKLHSLVYLHFISKWSIHR
jgi:hypothetical protein